MIAVKVYRPGKTPVVVQVDLPPGEAVDLLAKPQAVAAYWRVNEQTESGRAPEQAAPSL